MGAQSVAWGRVTASCWDGSKRLWTGHEGGWVARWERPDPEDRALTLSASWLAHEGAVRQLSPEVEGGVESLGADGSWVRWSEQGQSLKRGRAPQLMANAGVKVGDTWVIASDRGVLSRVRNGERLWRTAGEHRRAAFALSVVGEELLSVGSDGWLRRWRLKDGSALGARAAHQGWATSLIKLTPPAALGGPVWVTGGADGVVRVWPNDVAKAQQELPPVEGARGHQADLTRLVGWWPWVVSGGEDGQLSLYRLEVVAGSAQVHAVSRSALFKGPVMSLSRWGACVLAGGGQSARDVVERCVEGGELRPSALTLREP